MSPTRTQISAGGVVYREEHDAIKIALISVGEPARWQLPKGTAGSGETELETALREVREETGIVAEVLEKIDRIEFWFVVKTQVEFTRIHKFVHFYLMRYLSGDIREHDHEVNEAIWVEINQAIQQLSFEGEKKMVRRAQAMIAGREQAP